MNKKLFTLLCASALVCGTFGASAKELPEPPMDAPHHNMPAPEFGMRGKHFGPNKEEMKKMDKKLADELNLTKEQKEKAKAIRKSGREKVKPLMDEMRAIREKIDGLREENMKEFESILTPEQKVKFDKIKADKDARKHDKIKNKQDRKGLKEAKKQEKTEVKK